MSEIKTKKCTKCNVIKTRDLFPKRGGKCKECFNQAAREYRKKKKEEALKNKNNVSEKKCGYCNKVKLSSEFRINRARCKDCEREYGRNYNKNNYDKRRKWATDNKERMAELVKNHYEKNKTEIRRKERERRKTDPIFKLIKDIKAQFHHCVKGNSSKYRGVDFNLISEWFEFKMTDEMNWDNYGDYWHSDHVIPISQFDLSKKVHVDFCFDWKNLSPMVGKENMTKKYKLRLEEVLTHIIDLDEFLKSKNMNENIFIRKYYELSTDLFVRNTLLRETPKALTTSHSLETLNDTHVSCVGRSKNVKDVSN